MSTFGWTFMSRKALRHAEDLLAGEPAGVRDEIGFLLIHQRYADRFFPGTSVLHTRLRYVLFVPWMYETLRQGPPIKSVNRTVEQAECHLAGRLLNAGDGVIGRLKYPEPISQPPSIVYWTAFGAWGLLRVRNGGTQTPSRARVHAALQSKSRLALDDDGIPINTPDSPFIALPPSPQDWGVAMILILFFAPRKPLSFRLTSAKSLPAGKIEAPEQVDIRRSGGSLGGFPLQGAHIRTGCGPVSTFSSVGAVVR